MLPATAPPALDRVAQSDANSLNHDLNKKCWKAELSGAKQTSFSPQKPVPVRRSLSKDIVPPPSSSSPLGENATIVRAAWALVLGRYCDSDDICFGTSVSSPESTEVVPIRLRLDPAQTVADFVRGVQTHALGVDSQQQQLGLQNVTTLLGENAQAADAFSSLLVVGKAADHPVMERCSLVMHVPLHDNEITQLTAHTWSLFAKGDARFATQMRR